MGIIHTKVSAIPDCEDTGLIRPSDWNAEHSIDDLEVTEIRLIPQVTSIGAEGTMYYCSVDDHVYVATE